jgi:DNA-damage-inducible protein J
MGGTGAFKLKCTNNVWTNAVQSGTLISSKVILVKRRIDMSKDSTIYTRIEEEDKRKFEKLVSSFGLSSSQAIRIFIKQSLIEKSIPFQVGFPNEETLRAFEEAEDYKNLPSYGSFKELRDDIEE